MQASFTKKKPSQFNKLAEYQEQGVPQLVTILEHKGGEFLVLNSQNTELTLASNRVFQLPGNIPPQFTHRNQIVSYLRELIKESNKVKEKVCLDRAWEAFRNNNREVTLEQIQRQLFPNQNLANLIGVRWALLTDKYYFKRGKTGFTARQGDSVESIKLAVAAQEQKRTLIKSWVDSIISKNPESEAVLYLERVAALGKKEDRWEDIEELLSLLEASEFKIVNKRIEDQAFDLLVQLGIFSIHENLTPIKMGRIVTFSTEEIEAAKALKQIESTLELFDADIFTIDGDGTKDFDDALSFDINASGYQLGIHISDVSSYIEKDGVLWNTSLKRASTIYTADQNFPMLPHVASEEFLSLIKDKTRNAISIFAQFNKNFELLNYELRKTKITVNNRITYDELDNDFEQNKANEKFKLLLELSLRLEQARIYNGARVLPKREMLPVINEDGQVSLELINEETPARKLVGEMMILANHCMASYAKNNEIPFIYRHQEPPDTYINQDLIPEGPAREYALRGIMKRSVLSCSPALHHGLALDCYCQCTSPIRRAIDLINQHQLNQHLQSAQTLSSEDLENLIPNLDESLGEVTYIQRKRHRYWLLTYLEQSGVKEVAGTVVKSDGPKPLVEIDELFLTSQFQPTKNRIPKVGSRVKLKLEQISARLDRLKLNEYDG